MGYQGEGEGEVGREMIDTSRQTEAEQEWFAKKAGRVFGEVEGKVTGKLERWEVGGTQDVGRYVYPVEQVNDGKKDVGKEVDTQADDEVGNVVDAGVEFHW